MRDRVCPPRRMRFSFESRCRLVLLVPRRSEPAGGRGRLRCEPRDRLSAVASLPRGRLGGARRSAAGAAASAAAAAAGARAADPGRTRVCEGGPGDRRRPARPARLDRLEGAAPLRRLPAARGLPAVRSSATSASGRASSCTSTSRSSAASGLSASASTATGSPATATPAGSTCTSRSTTTPASPTPSCCRARARPTASPSSAAPSAGTREHGITVERVLSDNGNGHRSFAWRDHLRRARDRPPLHPPPPAADQRQSRSARQDPAPRMGLPLRLPHQRPPRPCPPRLPPLVQPPPTAQLTRRTATDQPRLTGLWVPQLAARRGCPRRAGRTACSHGLQREGDHRRR